MVTDFVGDLGDGKVDVSVPDSGIWEKISGNVRRSVGMSKIWESSLTRGVMSESQHFLLNVSWAG